MSDQPEPAHIVFALWLAKKLAERGFDRLAGAIERRLSAGEPPLRLSFDRLRDRDCYEARGRADDPDLETYRVGVLNGGRAPVTGVIVEVVRIIGGELGYGVRPLRHKNDHLTDGEYRESIAGIRVRPNGDRSSVYFDAVHKFRRDVPDSRYPTGHRLTDHVYISYADDQLRAVAVPDNVITGIVLRLRSDRGPEDERTYSVVVGDDKCLYLNEV